MKGYCAPCRRDILYENPPLIQTVAWDRELSVAYRKAVTFGSRLGYKVPRRKIVFRGGMWCVLVYNESSNPPYAVIHVDGEPPTHLHPESRRLIHEIIPPATLAEQGAARRGTARHSWARQGIARQGKAWVKALGQWLQGLHNNNNNNEAQGG